MGNNESVFLSWPSFAADSEGAKATTTATNSSLLANDTISTTRKDDNEEERTQRPHSTAFAKGNEPHALMQSDVCDDYGNYVLSEESFDENMREVAYTESFQDNINADINNAVNMCTTIQPHTRSFSECKLNDTTNHWQKTDPYDCDDTEEKDVFCNTKGLKMRSQSRFPLPFQSCNALLEQGYSASVDEDGALDFDDTYHSEGELAGTRAGNRKRRRRWLDEKTMLSKHFGSYTNLSPLSFSTDPTYTDEELLMANGNDPTFESDLRPKVVQDGIRTTVLCRSFHVVTTAALPWMTGTAVNPLLRAAYLNQMNRHAVQKAVGEIGTMMGNVTLVIPWLFDMNDQSEVYGTTRFANKTDQERHVRDWLRNSAKLPLEADLETGGIHISFYDARYLSEFKSVIPIKSLCDEFQGEFCDVCILDEPEHLNVAFCDPKPFSYLFSHVVGIMHTNYDAYLKGSVTGIVIAPLAFVMINLTTRFHCHKIVKLSDTLQIFAKEKECVVNVHGIRQDFLDEGSRRALDSIVRKDVAQSQSAPSDSNDKIYFCGKLLWAKGLDAMIELEIAFKRITGEYFQLDIVGSGPEEEEIRRAFHGRSSSSNRTTDRLRSLSDYDDGMMMAKSSSVKDKMDQFIHTMPRSRFEFRKDCIPSNFLGRMDHATMRGDYKIFVNPSVTEVLCTTTAEALAMGKFIIIPFHPSNTFFEQFPNCLMYESKTHFVSQLQYAIDHNPTPLSEEHSFTLTWEAATHRLADASIITKREAKRRERVGQTKADLKAAEYLKSGIFETIRNYVRKPMYEVQ